MTAAHLSRRKGKLGEQEVARLLRLIYPDCHTKRAGGESASVDRGRDLLDSGPLCVQVKLHARPQPHQALAEAIRAAREREIAVAFTRQSTRSRSTGWAATLPALDFLFVMYVLERFRVAFPRRLEELHAAFTESTTTTEE